MIVHLLQAVVLGIVQGITEFLPVSSTAHLIITEHLFQLDQATYGLSFDMFTNLGTLLAVTIYFWPDLKNIFGKMRFPSSSRPLTAEEKTPWLIILATIPVGLIGMALESRIETDFRSISVIAASLIVVGVLMILAELFASHTQKPQKPSALQVVVTSLSQCIAFIPGVSRSGITISTAMFLKLDRVTAARYSFMLSIPITTAATLKKVADFTSSSISNGVAPDVLAFYSTGAITAFIAGYITLKFLLQFYQKYSLSAFAYYRIVLALILILFLSNIQV